ncbi:hypothetical protein VTN77DRAFT_888 [Rasamsonia byssochlamydoides]|uniref:uncharacterized protein n=1 Tax=Rasamsonia byssochlamydoides TaxID=89139 RepID=UPI0037433C5B
MLGTHMLVSEGQWQEDAEQRQRPPSSEHPEHSFHIRSRSSIHAHSPRRLSVFSGRSRSNTTTSTSSSRRSPASSMTSAEALSMQNSHEERTSSAAKQEKPAKSLLFRGSRILRRQGSKFSISATVDEEDEVGKVTQKFEVADFFRGHKSRQNSHDQLKRIISEPYDFHHLTHTSPAQFQALDNANDLVTEFSAIRASQKPVTELKGIRAEDIHFRNFSEDLTANERKWGARSPPATSPPLSPNVSPKSAVPKEPRVIENFSRPVSRLNKPLASPSIVPPPRRSSRQAVFDIPETTTEAMDEMLGLNQPYTMPDFVYPFRDDGLGETSSLERVDLADVFHSADVGHAYTTTDNDAKDTSAVAVINNYLNDLEDVPEEDETTWHGTTEIGSRPSTSRSLREEDSTPAVTTSDPPANECRGSLSPPDQGVSISEALMSPTLPQFRLTPRESPVSKAGDVKKRQSASKRAPVFEDFPPNWDEDIDYCYEHAAEANCDFDWEIPTVAVADVSPDVVAQPEQADSRLPRRSRGSLSHLRTSTSAPATPDLDPGSAQSELTRSHEAVTPLSEDADLFAAQARVSNHGDYFKPVDSDMAQDAMYEEFLAAGDDSDRHFAFYTQSRSQSVDIPVSPISKYNSEESIILSRAASIVRKHRSSTSTASVPDLVPSANSSRENTIRESMGSIEHGIFVDPFRQGPPSYHRQTKSLAPEFSSSNLRATRSSGSIDVVDVPSPVSPTRDRTKSVSGVEHETSHPVQKTEGPPFAVRMQSVPPAPRRKSRTSYSLFPGSSQRR